MEEFKYGGSCIFVRKELNVKEVTCFKDLSCKKNFEMSVVEIVDLKWLLICIYRSPHSDVYNFLDKLEALIAMVQQKKKKKN
jgi:hypothetical protein